MEAKATKHHTDTRSRAYRVGYRDGRCWDLDGYASQADLIADRKGWDDATLSGVGPTACAMAWGVRLGTRAFDRACREYNSGAYAGAVRQGVTPEEGVGGREKKAGK